MVHAKEIKLQQSPCQFSEWVCSEQTSLFLSLSLSITHFQLFFVHVVKSNIDNIEIALVVVGGEGDHLVISFSEVMM